MADTEKDNAGSNFRASTLKALKELQDSNKKLTADAMKKKEEITKMRQREKKQKDNAAVAAKFNVKGLQGLKQLKGFNSPVNRTQSKLA